MKNKHTLIDDVANFKSFVLENENKSYDIIFKDFIAYGIYIYKYNFILYTLIR